MLIYTLNNTKLTNKAIIPKWPKLLDVELHKSSSHCRHFVFRVGNITFLLIIFSHVSLEFLILHLLVNVEFSAMVSVNINKS